MLSTPAAARAVKLSRGRRRRVAGRVSPDGKLVAFVSDREPEPGNDADIWVRELAVGAKAPPRRRVTRAAGVESHPAWAPDNARVAYAAYAQGAVGDLRRGRAERQRAPAAPPAAARGRGVGAGAPAPPSTTRSLASRHLGVPAWSPDGQTLAHRDVRDDNAGYNGNPNRNDNDPPTRAGRRESVRAVARARAARGRRGRDAALAAGARCRAVDGRVRSGLADAEVAVLRERAVGRGVGRAARRSTGRGWPA